MCVRVDQREVAVSTQENAGPLKGAGVFFWWRGQDCLRRFAPQLVSAPLFRCYASGRLGLNYSEVLQMRQQSLKTADADLAGLNPDLALAKMKKPVPLGPALFIFGSGGVICTVPTVPQRVRVK
jgi:hypothetical protein